MSLRQGDQFSPEDQRAEIRKLQHATAKCTMLWNQIHEVLLKNIERKKKVRFALGKWVDDGEDRLAYVNNYGYVTAYSTKGDPRSERCMSPPLKLDESQMRHVISSASDDEVMGQAMTPCGVAGHNIMNAETGAVAWVDVRGVKHEYDRDVWKDKQSSCDIEPIQVTRAEWSSLPSGGKMTRVSLCNRLDIDNKLLIEYGKATTELRNLVDNVGSKIKGIEEASSELNLAIAAARKNLSRQISAQDKVREAIKKDMADIVSVSGELQNSHITFKSNQLDFLVWTILALTVIGLAIAALLSPSNRLGDFVLVTLALVTIYWIATLFYEYYYF